MKKEAVLSLLVALLLGALAVVAQEGESQDEAEPAPQEPVAAPGEGGEGEPVSDDSFIPSEEVQAAEELTFPVNI